MTLHRSRFRLPEIGIQAVAQGNDWTRHPIRHGFRQQSQSAYRQQNQCQQAAVVVHAHRPCTAHGSQRTDAGKRQTHSDKQGKSAADKSLPAAGKNEWQDRKNARTQNRQDSANKRQNCSDHIASSLTARIAGMNRYQFRLDCLDRSFPGCVIHHLKKRRSKMLLGRVAEEV